MAKQKIAIVGGGVGGMSAAWALSGQPGWQDRYEITVYQMGWRLGGKGASGRGPDGRIQEHGLHIWLGFYENAFRVMRSVFKELKNKGEQHVFTSVEEAFVAHSLIGVMEKVDKAWRPFMIDFPPAKGVPGDGTPKQYADVWQVVVAGLALLADWLEKVTGLDRVPCWWPFWLCWPIGSKKTSNIPPTGHRSRRRFFESALQGCEGDWRTECPEIAGAFDHLLKSADRSLPHLAAELAKVMPADWADHKASHRAILLRVLDEARKIPGELAEKTAWQDDGLRRAYIVLDLAYATVNGLLTKRAEIDAHGLGVFDDLDFQEFFRKYGASKRASEVATSAPVRGFYDLVFAYEDGHPERPNFAAGVALRSAICILMLYKQAIFMKMRAGMGDTIFAPLHKALVNRGVTFKFFHRLEDMEIGGPDDQPVVKGLRFNVQANVKQGEYQPYVCVQGLDCWPQAPLTDQLVEGEQILKGPDGSGTEGWNGNWKGYNLEDFWTTWRGCETKELALGEDFDLVILAVPPASHPFVCPKITAKNPRWKAMVEDVASVRTQAMQLWLRSTLKELGWKYGSPVLDAFLQPMNTWADMTHLLDREDWPISASPATLAYFCGPMVGGIPAPGERGVMAAALAEVEKTANEWLSSGPGAIWPDGSTGGALDRDELVLDVYEGGHALMRGQYWRANVSPSERYVMSKKGTTKARIAARETGFENLFVAGDWTRNGFNAGCVEAAVMSGLLASQAICGAPSDNDIETYWSDKATYS